MEKASHGCPGGSGDVSLALFGIDKVVMLLWGAILAGEASLMCEY